MTEVARYSPVVQVALLENTQKNQTYSLRIISAAKSTSLLTIS
jgi:hypothetical protein